MNNIINNNNKLIYKKYDRCYNIYIKQYNKLLYKEIEYILLYQNNYILNELNEFIFILMNIIKDNLKNYKNIQESIQKYKKLKKYIKVRNNLYKIYIRKIYKCYLIYQCNKFIKIK